MSFERHAIAILFDLARVVDDASSDVYTKVIMMAVFVKTAMKFAISKDFMMARWLIMILCFSANADNQT